MAIDEILVQDPQAVQRRGDTVDYVARRIRQGILQGHLLPANALSPVT